MKKFLKRCTALMSCLALKSALAATPNSFASMQTDITAASNTHIGMMVLDPTTGAVLYQYQAGQYFHPASTSKLFTAIAAMLGLGEHFQFMTTLNVATQNIHGAVIEGDVYLKFSGDPSLTSQDLNTLLMSLQAHGIKEIHGHVILDDTIFPPDADLGVAGDDSMWEGGVPASSIMINENSVVLNFKKDTATPQLLNATPDIPVHSQLAWLNDTNAKLYTFKASPAGNNGIYLSGCLPQGLSQNLALALPNPNAYAQQLVQEDLKNLGIDVQGGVLIGAMPQGTPVFANHASAMLPTLLTHMLKDSDNLYASAITKSMGLKAFNTGTEKAGVSAIQTYLAPYHLPYFDLETGSGLSYYNLVSPLVLSELLYQAQQDKNLAAFLQSALPIAGVDGTLQSFPSPLLKGKVIAKTGTLMHVAALAGFITTEQGKTLIFSLMMDDSPLNNTQLKNLQAKILEDVYRSF